MSAETPSEMPAGATQEPQDEQDELNRAVGRPLKFASAEVLKKALDDYFDKCDAGKPAEVVSQGRVVKYTEKIPYTITGLCIVLDIDRSTLTDYGAGRYDKTDPEFSPTVKKAKQRVLEAAEQNLYNGKPPAGTIFSLKNNDGWKDKTEFEGELTGNMTVQTVSYAGAAAAIKAAKERDQGDDDGTATATQG